jgi:hypothetical protein
MAGCIFGLMQIKALEDLARILRRAGRRHITTVRSIKNVYKAGKGNIVL